MEFGTLTVLRTCRFANMVIYHRGNAGCGSLIASGLSQRMGSETCHDAIHRRDVLVVRCHLFKSVYQFNEV